MFRFIQTFDEQQAWMSEANDINITLKKTKDSVNNTPILKSAASNFEVFYIPRRVYELAYENDLPNKNRTGGAQSIDTIIRRGGYTIEEFNKLLPNLRWYRKLSESRLSENSTSKLTHRTDNTRLDSFIAEGFSRISGNDARKYTSNRVDIKEKIEDFFLPYIDRNQSQKPRIESVPLKWNPKNLSPTPKYFTTKMFDDLVNYVQVYRFVINLKIYLELDKIDSIIERIKKILPELKYLYHEVESKMSSKAGRGSTKLEIYFSITEEINDKVDKKQSRISLQPVHPSGAVPRKPLDRNRNR